MKSEVLLRQIAMDSSLKGLSLKYEIFLKSSSISKPVKTPEMVDDYITRPLVGPIRTSQNTLLEKNKGINRIRKVVTFRDVAGQKAAELPASNLFKLFTWVVSHFRSSNRLSQHNVGISNISTTWHIWKVW